MRRTLNFVVVALACIAVGMVGCGSKSAEAEPEVATRVESEAAEPEIVTSASNSEAVVEEVGKKKLTGKTVETTSESAEEPEEQKLDTAAIKDSESEYQVEVKNGEISTDANGANHLIVHMTYTNTGTDPLYMLECFSVRAFQNDTELEDSTDINDGTQEMLNTIVEVKDGQSIDCAYSFKLDSMDTVELRVSEPTADEDLLLKKDFILQ